MEIKRAKHIFLNGRFLTQPVTGVQRTACEIVLAIDHLLAKGEISPDEYQFTLIYSGKLVNPIKLKYIALLKKGILSGNAWEQLELPFYTAGRLLISMCTISCLLKRKQVVFVHDASFIVNPTFFNIIFRTWYRFAITFLGKIALRIITVSQFSKAELVRHLGMKEAKVSVIYNSGEHILRYDAPDPEFVSSITALKPYVLAVSSRSENKNFKNLGLALKDIELDRYNLLIAGGVPATLQAGAEDPGVSYLGYVSNEQLKYLYANASLFVFPSYYEGFGIPPVEAMISGCAVVASNTSSLPEVLGDGCFYFDPYSVKDMTRAISLLLTDSELLAEIKKQGMVQAKRYRWKKSAKALFDMVAPLA